MGPAAGIDVSAVPAGSEQVVVHFQEWWVRLRGSVDAIRLSRATLRTIKQNLAWAFGYNLAALPLAAAGLLNPIVAGAAMALSSVSVVGNALRLRRFRPAQDVKAR